MLKNGQIYTLDIQLSPDGKLIDDIDDATRSEIYGAVLKVVQSDLAKTLQMKRLPKPTKTLEGIKIRYCAYSKFGGNLLLAGFFFLKSMIGLILPRHLVLPR